MSKRRNAKNLSMFDQLREAVTTLSKGRVNGKNATLNEFEIFARKTYNQALAGNKRALREIFCEDILLAELRYDLEQRGGVFEVPKELGMTCEEWVAKYGRNVPNPSDDNDNA